MKIQKISQQVQNIDPQMTAMINQVIRNSGVSKEKALQLIQGLIGAMNDVPLSKVTQAIEALTQEDTATQQPQQPQQAVPQQQPQNMTQPNPNG